MSDVFISYSRKDIAYARLLQSSLQNSDIETWIDWDRIPIGEKWWDEITQAIENANVFLFIISGSSVASEVCGKEIQLALQNHKRVIPIVIDEITPEQARAIAPELPDINWIVFQRDHLFHLEHIQAEKAEDGDVAVPKLPEFEQALEKLSSAIHTDWEWVKFHTQLQVDALNWQNAAQDSAYLLRGSALAEAEQKLIQAAGKQPTVSELQIQFTAASREFENAEQQKQLALEQRARQRQRVALWAIAIGLATAIVLGVLAWGQRNQYLDETIVRATAQAVAEEQRGIAEQQSQIAIEQQGIAEEQKGIAEEQRGIAIVQRDQAIARQVAAQGIATAGQEYDLGLLMGVEAVKRSAPDTWAYRDLFQITQADPRLLAYARGHSADAYGVAVSPTEPIVVTVGNDDSFIVWDVSDPTQPTILSGPNVVGESDLRSAAISPDGKILAIGSFGGSVRLYDISDPANPAQVGKTRANHTQSVNALAFHPDGMILASGSEEGNILLWDVSDPANFDQFGEALKWRFGGVLSLTFSPDGNLLAPTCFNKFITDIFFWDLSDINAPELISNPSTVQTDAIAFHPSLPRVAVGSMDGRVSLWDISNPRAPVMVIGLMRETYTQVFGAKFSPDGNTLITATSEKTLIMYDTSDPSQLVARSSKMFGHRERITQLALSPDGAVAYSTSWDDSMIIWDVRDLRVPIRNGARLPLPDSNGIAAIHPSLPLVATGTTGQTISTYDVSDPYRPILLDSAPLASGNARDIRYSPDGKLIAVACVGSTIEVFSVDENGALTPYTSPIIGHSSFIERVKFSADGKFMASSDFGYNTYLWRIEDGKIRPVGRSIPGIRAAFAPDGAYVAVAGDDTLEIWDLSNPTDPIKVSVYQEEERMVIFELVYHPNGKLIYAAGTDGNLIIFDVSDPANPERLYPTIIAQNDMIHSLDIHPDGQTLVLGSADNQVSFWDITNPTSPTSYGAVYGGLKNTVADVEFAENGKKVLSSGSAGEVVLWNFDPSGLIGQACSISGRNMTVEEWSSTFPVDEPYQKTCFEGL